MRHDLGASADAETGSREPGLAARPGPTGFDPARLGELAECCEQAEAGGVREVKAIMAANEALASARFIDDPAYSRCQKFITAGAYLDAAMTLVPSTTANFDLFSYIGEHKPTWGCHFHDTAQLMGKRAAKEEIARMQKSGVFGGGLRGAPRIVMEKAIAEHFIEFMCMGAVTPALAVCAAALKARAASGTPTQRAETTGSVGEADGGPTVATSDGDAQPQSEVNRHG